MNQEDILSGKAGVAGIQRVLNGQSSRRLLRSEVQTMLRPGYRAGPFHLTRAKFKPGRKLSAYFTFPALEAVSQASHLVHLAVTWQKDLDGINHADSWSQLQEEARQSGLMPVQSELWKELLTRESSFRFGRSTRSFRSWFAWAIPPMLLGCLHLLELPMILSKCQ